MLEGTTEEKAAQPTKFTEIHSFLGDHALGRN